jgi:hypothetical protein
MPEKGQHDRRDFVKKCLGVIVFGSLTAAPLAYGTYLSVQTIQLCNEHSPRTIEGRVRSITPKYPSLDDSVHLVLTNEKSDWDFYFKPGDIFLPPEREDKGSLFRNPDHEENRRRTDTHRELVMTYLRQTHVGDQVEIRNQPMLCVDNRCYGIVDYINHSFVERLKDKNR